MHRGPTLPRRAAPKNGAGGRRLVLGAALGTALAGAAAALAVRRVVVAGASMAPALVAGDRLVILRLPVRWLRPGDLVALFDPRGPAADAALLVKRVVSAGPAGVAVAGDNPDASTDSRTFGPVPPTKVLGRALYRYGPPGRTGRLRRAPPVPGGS